MAFAAAKITELPLRSALPITSRSESLRRLFRAPKPSVQSVRSCISCSLRTSNPRKPKKPSQKAEEDPPPPYFDGERGKNAIEKIVLRLRNLGVESDDEEDVQFGGFPATGEERLGELLKREWVRPDSFLAEDEGTLPWERKEAAARDVKGKDGRVGKVVRRAPTLAEMTVEEEELKRLIRMGMVLRQKINIPKAGITKEVLDKIHGMWKKEELAKLKFHEVLAHDMKTAHEIVERRTGGLVIWRSGSVMFVYRGANYDGPVSKPEALETAREAPSVPDVASANELAARSAEDASVTLEESGAVTVPVINGENLTEEEIEYNRLLDGLGPRFEEWWGTGVLPVDADLLPQKIPGYKTPFRLLPSGMRSRLTNDEMTNLRKVAKSLPCHFALGRNRNHQGLAAAIIKLWEKSLVAKIAVKRGIQNTNNKLMSEELKNLTGGVLLLRNKYYIVIYRGKDFLPPSVATALLERQQLAKQIQDVEEKVRTREIEEIPSGHYEGHALAGTLAEFYEAQTRWGREISAEEHQKMIEEASKSKSVRLVKKIEHKLAVAQSKKLRAERLLSKVEASMVPSSPDEDQETITEEERAMFRRVGLQMKQYLPMGIRGVFDGVIENMHLHWKHRELVKLLSKQKTLAFVEDTARLLEYESGGVLVSIERVSKGFALIYYRGKNYRRPITLRPRNLLTKAKALKRSIAMQRHEALSQHIAELEKTIEQMKSEIGDVSNMDNEETLSFDENGPTNRLSEFMESEDEAASQDMEDDSDDDDEDYDDENDDDWEDGEESELS